MALALIVALMLPVVILTYTERNPFWVSALALLLPLGLYTMMAALSRRSGIVAWCALPLLFLSALQVVLSYLFGNSVQGFTRYNLRAGVGEESLPFAFKTVVQNIRYDCIEDSITQKLQTFVVKQTSFFRLYR